ncbi:MAG: ABC transporter ATP-binding protein [Leptospira sp.]|nr:ABC transporter ATP-binding protein [Leptospira sp.]
MGEVTLVALHSVNIEITKGELIVILGPSGSGKSTLLNILGALDTPSEGKVYFEGDDISKGNDDDLTLFRREHVGFVFQFYNLIPSLTAKENVQLVTDLTKKSMLAEDALKLVDLGDRVNHFPSQMSGGQQQRVAIARAIAKKPDLLLCDEPTGALDFKTGKIVLDALAKVNVELGTTTIIITHNETIAQIADRIILVKDGTIVSDVKNKKKLRTEDISW